MRKRAELKSRPETFEPKHITENKPRIFDRKTESVRKNWWVAVALISIFFLVLLFNTYFNVASDIAIYSEGNGYSKYLLSGPDPYYNMRLVDVTSQTGKYPYYSDLDPLLNYPLGKSSYRGPLLNMMSLGFSNFLAPFMGDIDAIGYSMQFIPALFGALIVFPVFFIGKILFNKKVGLIAAFFIAIIPIHIGSGHGSAYSLFDHDSLNLLLFFITFLFLILSLKEKNRTKSIFYAILAGVPLAGLSMVWVEAQFLYVCIAIYAIIQMIIDIFSSKIELNVVRATSFTLLTAYILSLPINISQIGGFHLDTPLLMTVVVVGFGLLYYIFALKRIPWTISLPFIFISGGVGIVFLYIIKYFNWTSDFLAGFDKISEILFGSGIYGNKVSMTIAEANTYEISQTVMNFGPALYWVGWFGFIFILWYYYRDKLRRDYLFFIILFIVDLWLTGSAGRFLNDMAPLIAIFAAFITWYVVDKVDYKQMVKNIRSAGGGLHGIRRGIKIMHIFGVLLIAFIFILPSVFITFDAAIPEKVYLLNENETEWSTWKQDYFLNDSYSGVFGLSLYKEGYWIDAFDWLAQQDVYNKDGLKQKDEEKPAFISWWDYGFYEVAIAKHPTVADNFQDGIPTASNFHTSTSEKDAIAVWIVRLLEGNKKDGNGKLSENVKEVLVSYLGQQDADNVSRWIETPTSSPSYHKWINVDFNQYMRDEFNKNLLKVGAQWSENAVYHDMVDLFNNKTNLSEEDVTWLYHDLQEKTGYSIRYYGVEGYDRQIFNIFAFLSDKSLVLLGAPSDEFVNVTITSQQYDPYTRKYQESQTSTLKEYLEMSDDEKTYTVVTGTDYDYKSAYFDTMFYRTYIGPYQTDSTGQRSIYDYQVPCYNMKHFYAEYISNMSDQFLRYPGTNKAAVVIAKYYEGALVNGSVLFNGKPMNNYQVVIQKKLRYSSDYSLPIDYDTTRTNNLGNFNLIAGAGSIIEVRRSIGDQTFIVTNVTFNGEEGSVYAPITDDDAMRQPDSNYERFLNISVKPASIGGYIYDDMDGNGLFNKSTDLPLKDINVIVQEIASISSETDPTTGQTQQTIGSFGSNYTVKSNEYGYYNISGLLPGLYRLDFYDENNFKLDETDMGLIEGNNTYNVTKPESAGLEGVVYYDENMDGEYSDNEEVNQADVQLYHIIPVSSTQYAEDLINQTKTDANGNYMFEDLFPGKVSGRELNAYVVRVTKSPLYESYIPVYPVENETTLMNISVELINITISGQAKYGSDTISNVDIIFEPDESETKNTAIDTQISTDGNGKYSIGLRPGKYNITVQKYDRGNNNPNTLIYERLGEKITIEKGQENISSLDFTLIKKSVNISGVTKENDTMIDDVNITINFKKSETENNTAIATKATAVNGRYTVEITPGTYNVSAESVTFNVSGVNYTYKWTGELIVEESDITEGITLPINKLVRVKK